ncbi:MAG: hypothetical protein PHQ36_06720 [Anaerolineales bacterium]|nr:hypothetical protein [Anaerolineales bacterium]
MNSVFDFNQYVLKRQFMALGGKFRVFDSSENLVLYVEQKLFKLREDIRVYADESKAREILVIKARQIVDFSAAYDVMDSATGQKVGALRRKGLASMLRDEWEVLDVNDAVIGKLFEDSMGLALVRRFLSNLVPQNYDLLIGATRVADYKQNFNPFTYALNIDFSMDAAKQLDRRLGLAAAILLAAIEGKQS